MASARRPRESAPPIHSPRKTDEGRRGENDEVETRVEGWMQVGVVGRAPGSAYVETPSGIQVMATCYGPRPVDTSRTTERMRNKGNRGKLQCHVEKTEFADTTKVDESTAKEWKRQASGHLRKALEGAVQLDAFPKAQVDVHVIVLQANGDEMPHVVVAAALALADAGIAMVDLVAACHVGRTAAGTLHPNQDAKDEQGHVVVCCMPTQGNITHLMQQGSWSAAQVLEVGVGKTRSIASTANTLHSFLPRSLTNATSFCDDAGDRHGRARLSTRRPTHARMPACVSKLIPTGIFDASSVDGDKPRRIQMRASTDKEALANSSFAACRGRHL